MACYQRCLAAIAALCFVLVLFRSISQSGLVAYRTEVENAPPFWIGDATNWKHGTAASRTTNATYSSLEINIPRVALLDTRQQQFSGREVHMTNVMWNGRSFVLYGSHLQQVPKILTTKMHTHWYYPKYAHLSHPVIATKSNSPFRESDCTGGIVEESVFVTTPPNYCSNHYHILHDEIMPLMAAMGSSQGGDGPLQSWNTSQVRVMMAGKELCDYPLLMKPFSKIISTHPVERFPPQLENICFRHIVLSEASG